MDYLIYENNLRQLRKNKSISQKELAILVECSRSNISNIENSKQDTTLRMAGCIARVLKVSVVDIFPWLEEKVQ